MSSKPLTDVLAQVYVGERFNLNADTVPWENMSDEARSLERGAMAEVIRTLGLFGWEVFSNDKGMGVRRIQVEEAPPKELPDSLDPMGLGPVQRTDESVSSAKQKGFTGIPCDSCGSLNTVRNGKCLLCMDCHASGECG